MKHNLIRRSDRCRICASLVVAWIGIGGAPAIAQDASGEPDKVKNLQGVSVTAQRGATLAEQVESIKARYTAPHNRIAALNDGLIPESTGPEMQQKLWGTWGSPQPFEEVWVEYRWKQPVQIHQSAVYFWADQSISQQVANCADLGVQYPMHWKVMYYDDHHDWVEVANPSGYPVRFGGASDVSFDSVRTTRLRVVMEPFGRGRCRAAVGIKEWAVE